MYAFQLWWETELVFVFVSRNGAGIREMYFYIRLYRPPVHRGILIRRVFDDDRSDGGACWYTTTMMMGLNEQGGLHAKNPARDNRDTLVNI